MKRNLKPNERVALFASFVAIAGGLTPLLSRAWSKPDPNAVFGLFSGDFVSGFLLGLIGVLLIGGVALWLKGRPAD